MSARTGPKQVLPDWGRVAESPEWMLTAFCKNAEQEWKTISTRLKKQILSLDWERGEEFRLTQQAAVEANNQLDTKTKFSVIVGDLSVSWQRKIIFLFIGKPNRQGVNRNTNLLITEASQLPGGGLSHHVSLPELSYGLFFLGPVRFQEREWEQAISTGPSSCLLASHLSDTIRGLPVSKTLREKNTSINLLS